ncbi:MAG TPA: pyridoxamine 5'-phosphate oxidase family protein [Acidimicrobiia bacterium]|nr:pyridoxamine 5'-phosphate oxidase family protein [Acidimicrobiia bacterium]
MGAVRQVIDDELREWIERQPVFFVASAPLAGDGHVNLSPKGLDTFRVLDEDRVGYLDLTGSGAETIAHLRENGRITVLFCAFDGPPRILRLFGEGTPHLIGSEGFQERVEMFGEVPHSTRAVIDVEVTRIQTSCGFGVPLMGLVAPRDRLTQWGRARTSAELDAYRATKNARSIDGLPAFDHSAASG